MAYQLTSLVGVPYDCVLYFVNAISYWMNKKCGEAEFEVLSGSSSFTVAFLAEEEYWRD